ncbi:MAG: hypothetical protein ACFN4S_00810, partial [Prevotella conceptionensis]
EQGAAIFSPFQFFTLSPLRAQPSFHPFTRSPLKVLFAPSSPHFLPIKHKKVGLKFGGMPENKYLCTR